MPICPKYLEQFTILSIGLCAMASDLLKERLCSTPSAVNKVAPSTPHLARQVSDGWLLRLLDCFPM